MNWVRWSLPWVSVIALGASCKIRDVELTNSAAGHGGSNPGPDAGGQRAGAEGDAAGRGGAGPVRGGAAGAGATSDQGGRAGVEAGGVAGDPADGRAGAERGGELNAEGGDGGQESGGVGGAPPPDCDDGRTRCGAACVDLETDASHCGDCETECSEDQECFSGACCAPPRMEGDCSPFPTCGCEGGEICAPSATTHTMQCVEAGSLREGVPCSDQDCAEGLVCLSGICKAYCSEAAQCAEVDGVRACVSATLTGDTLLTGYNVCRRICDPANPQDPVAPLRSCPEGYGCLPDAEGASDCVPAGNGAEGTACTAEGFECAPGLFCRNEECVPYCFSDADCPESVCVFSLGAADQAGSSQVGFCSMLRCEGGQVPCGEQCVDVEEDPTNCGDCGVTCEAGQICSAGACLICSEECGPSDGICDDGGEGSPYAYCDYGTDCPDCGPRPVCDAGLSSCGGECVDLARSPENCGVCGRVCEGAEPTCFDGQCGVCSDTCPGNNGDDYCDDGGPAADYNLCPLGTDCTDCDTRYVPACLEGLTYCDEGCVDLQTDPNNCGACRNACLEGAACMDGVCPLCSDSCGLDVDDACLDGGEGAEGALCPLGTECSDCGPRCPTGLTVCDDACVDTASDASHCGGCDVVCGEGEVCVEGACGLCADTCGYAGDGECDDGGPESSYDVCGYGSDCADCGFRVAPTCEAPSEPCLGGCRDFTDNTDHCGACHNACASGATCEAGVCAPLLDGICAAFVECGIATITQAECVANRNACLDTSYADTLEAWAAQMRTCMDAFSESSDCTGLEACWNEAPLC